LEEQKTVNLRAENESFGKYKAFTQKKKLKNTVRRNKINCTTEKSSIQKVSSKRRPCTMRLNISAEEPSPKRESEKDVVNLRNNSCHT
jgi:hypothetical protein